MKFAVIQFPGSNCDIDLYEALHTVCGADVAYVPSKESSLDGFDAVMLPGGFSYGDYLRSRRYCPLYQYHAAIVEMAKAGKPVFRDLQRFPDLDRSWPFARRFEEK